MQDSKLWWVVQEYPSEDIFRIFSDTACHIMLSEINDSLRRIVQEQRDRKKLQRKKRRLRYDLKTFEKDFQMYQEFYDSDYNRLNQLEKLRLDKWMPFFGKSLEKKILRCRVYLVAMNNLTTQISEVEKQLIEIDHQLENLGEIDELYDDFIREKEKFLLNSSDSHNQVLLDHLEAIENTRIDIKEIREAISAGKKLFHGYFYLENLFFDPEEIQFGMIGMMLWRSNEKQTLLENIENVQKTINYFVQELKDVLERMPFDPSINHEAFPFFATGFTNRINNIGFNPRDFEKIFSFMNNTKNRTNRCINELKRMEKKKLQSLKNQKRKKEFFLRDV